MGCGASPDHIYASHAQDLKVSERTLYRYIDNNVFSIRNLDLPKKVRYRKRRQPKILTKMEYKYRRGRTYEDFNKFISANPDISVVEMDTVRGKKMKGKVLLTLIFRKTDFMLVFLMESGTQQCVRDVFDSLTDLLGLEIFRKLFGVILTDNGVEFKDPCAPSLMPWISRRFPRMKSF